uniref:Peroxidase 3 (Fragments) n=1 Tax=Capsicum annuum TaxID=4072 RepID=PER3_CAPAN|nr:RecName: Full=Peroxidase 3 [Capsicum annuum]
GFEVIDNIKDSVVILGGPNWNVKMGDIRPLTGSNGEIRFDNNYFK